MKQFGSYYQYNKQAKYNKLQGAKKYPSTMEWDEREKG